MCRRRQRAREGRQRLLGVNPSASGDGDQHARRHVRVAVARGRAVRIEHYAARPESGAVIAANEPTCGGDLLQRERFRT